MMTTYATTSPTSQTDVSANRTNGHLSQVRDSNQDRLNGGTTDPQLKAVALRLYLQRSVDQNQKSGVLTGVTVMDLQRNRSLFNHKVDTEHFAASVNKNPVALLVLRDLRAGKLVFDQQVNWTAADVRGGAGVYDQPGAPLQASVEDLLFDMLNPSGNTAVRALVNGPLGGAAAVNERFKSELGLQHTYLQLLEGTAFYIGYSTPAEAIKALSQLLEGDDQYQEFVKNALATNIYTDFGVRTQLAGNDFIVLANKVGILDDPEGNNRHDVGIIYNTHTSKSYGYAFMNTAYGPAYNLPTAQAGVSLADMGRGVLRYSGDKKTGSEKALRDEAPFIDRRVRY